MSESAKDVMELANKARDIFEEEEYVNIIGERIAALIQSSFEAWARERLSPAMRDMGMEDCEISEVLQAVPSSRQAALNNLR